MDTIFGYFQAPTRRRTSTTILNGFGISAGDSIIGLQALQIARAMGVVKGTVFLGRNATPQKPLVPQIYQRARDLAAAVPMAAAPTEGYVLDIRDFAFDPGFARISMIDYFLAKLGVDPATVPSGQKRNTWLAPRLGPLPDLGLPQDYILLCPKASIALRDMPQEAHRAFLQALAARGVGPVVTQGPAEAGAIGAPYCETIEALGSLVARARIIVSTDTAMLHLADAFSVPCFALMTTHRPEWRVRDYPFCLAHHLPVLGLPESAEFVRGPEDLEAIRQAWSAGGQGPKWIPQVLDRFLSFVAIVDRGPLRRETVDSANRP